MNWSTETDDVALEDILRDEFRRGPSQATAEHHLATLYAERELVGAVGTRPRRSTFAGMASSAAAAVLLVAGMSAVGVFSSASDMEFVAASAQSMTEDGSASGATSERADAATSDLPDPAAQSTTDADPSNAGRPAETNESTTSLAQGNDVAAQPITEASNLVLSDNANIEAPAGEDLEGQDQGNATQSIPGVEDESAEIELTPLEALVSGGTILAGDQIDPASCNGVEATILGSNGPDVIVGTDGPDVIVGGNGVDMILGLDGADIICGGNGDDEIHGGAGDDQLFGENGDDILIDEAGDNVVDQGRGPNGDDDDGDDDDDDDDLSEGNSKKP